MATTGTCCCCCCGGGCSIPDNRLRKVIRLAHRSQAGQVQAIKVGRVPEADLANLLLVQRLVSEGAAVDAANRGKHLAARLEKHLAGSHVGLQHALVDLLRAQAKMKSKQGAGEAARLCAPCWCKTRRTNTKPMGSEMIMSTFSPSLTSSTLPLMMITLSVHPHVRMRPLCESATELCPWMNS